MCAFLPGLRPPGVFHCKRGVRTMGAIRMGEKESTMNAKIRYGNRVEASAGAIPGICTNAAMLLLCATLATLAITAALLLLTLPGALDALANPGFAFDIGAAYADERPAGQVIADWV